MEDVLVATRPPFPRTPHLPLIPASLARLALAGETLDEHDTIDAVALGAAGLVVGVIWVSAVFVGVCFGVRRHCPEVTQLLHSVLPRRGQDVDYPAPHQATYRAG